jgi:hypothetical protein
MINFVKKIVMQAIIFTGIQATGKTAFYVQHFMVGNGR